MAMALLNGLPEQYDALISAHGALGDDEDGPSSDHPEARVIQEDQINGIRLAASD